MPQSELSERNFKRISIINWLISIPFVILFAWPYLYICQFTSIETYFAYPGCLLFAIPFMITILHGHVTMALGTAHRQHYYDWLYEKPLTYGLMFHPDMMRTRFRLLLLLGSLFLFITGYFFS